MIYTETDYSTKRELLDAVKRGDTVRVFQPGPFGPRVQDGPNAVAGPQFPRAHKWYASVVVQDGVIVRAK